MFDILIITIILILININFILQVIKMLIGELNSTTGNVYINGHDIINDYSKARQYLGYCPQFDYLNDYLTVEETLKLFCQLRGLQASNILEIIKDIMLVFKLIEIRQKIIRNIRF
jgi:ABC-type multidrug transport system ATPase subunit